MLLLQRQFLVLWLLAGFLAVVPTPKCSLWAWCCFVSSSRLPVLFPAEEWGAALGGDLALPLHPCVWFMPAQSYTFFCGFWFWFGPVPPRLCFVYVCSGFYAVLVLLQPWVKKHCKRCVLFEVFPLVPQESLFRQRPAQADGFAAFLCW